MDVLIVGGAGFIGSNLADRFEHVTVLDNLASGAASNVPPQATFIEGDAADPEVWKRIGTNWDAIYHLGGASSAPMFDAAPLLASDAVRAFQNVLEAARHGGAKVAFASTSSFYNGCPKPYREEMAVAPKTLYEFSKLTMEHLASTYAARYEVPVTALRFFSVYGPREEAKGRFANLVSQFLWCLRAGIPPLIYGDGSQTRDFTHVDDLLDGLLLANQNPTGFEVYNIGTGVEHDLNQLVEKLQAATGIDLAPRFIPNPVANYVQETQADASRIQALGWKPRVDLDEGIRRLLESPVDGPVAAMRAAHG